ncbi:MAG: hypothetical protein ACYSU7_09485 [Planctomycetota bacterium]|jgi:hypothetical protein
MVRSQRILIGISLPLIALFLHATLCAWKWKGRTDPAKPILVYHHRENPGLASYGITPASGLFSQSGSVEVAVLFGVVVPLVLCVADAYLFLGWRYQAAVRRGRCPNCGYDRKGDRSEPARRCPECGWSSPSSSSTGDDT